MVGNNENRTQKCARRYKKNAKEYNRVQVNATIAKEYNRLQGDAKNARGYNRMQVNATNSKEYNRENGDAKNARGYYRVHMWLQRMQGDILDQSASV